MSSRWRRELTAGDRIRAAGKKVVLGWLHTTYRTEEAKPRADAVCIVDAEGLWQQILRDYRRSVHLFEPVQLLTGPAGAC